MRIDVQFIDRVGIAHEILALLAERRMNVVAMEVDPPHVFIDIPELLPAAVDALRCALLGVSGVHALHVVDVLPGTRRRLHLDALLAAMADPVLALDASGCVVVANAAAEQACGDISLEGKPIDQLFDEGCVPRDWLPRLLAVGLPAHEVSIRGKPFLLEVTPVSEGSQVGNKEVGSTVGAVLTLHAPQRLGGRIHALQQFADLGFAAIIGQSPAIKALKARAVRVAAVDAPLLILGETGTGKELVAQACHAASNRASAPFLALNCAALPESLAESELFGYTTGAFSGAQRGGKPGLIEMADGGSVFLDEIGEMSLYLQAKLLRFLNDGKFRRIGSEREIQVNVRIISATHRNLEKMVADGSFREDLFYRINVLQLTLPALRERLEDIPLLTRHFIERACQQSQKNLSRLSGAAQAALQDYAWPGNVRQLQNVIFRAITMSDHLLLDTADLGLGSTAKSGVAIRPGAPAGAGSRQFAGADNSANTGDADICHDWELAVEQFERDLLQRLYPRYPSSRKLAAQVKMSHSMMALKLKKYGIINKA
jgi:transcriptional regulator of aroF, aroG, tyrA and aromatic amino acid transport